MQAPLVALDISYMPHMWSTRASIATFIAREATWLDFRLAICERCEGQNGLNINMKEG